MQKESERKRTDFVELRKPAEVLAAEAEERKRAHLERVKYLKDKLNQSLKSRKSLIELHDMVCDTQTYTVLLY
jgi:hypothetical protein